MAFYRHADGSTLHHSEHSEAPSAGEVPTGASNKRFSMPLRRMEDVESHDNPICRERTLTDRAHYRAHYRTVTAAVRHELRQQFDFLDKGHNGAISLVEFSRLCFQAARTNDEATLQLMSKIIAASDKDGNRQMDFEEYVGLYTELLNSKQMQDGGFNFSMFRRLRRTEEPVSLKIQLRARLFTIPVQVAVFTMIITYLALSIGVVGFSYLPDEKDEQDKLNSYLLAIQILNNLLQLYYLLRLFSSNPSVYTRKTSHCFILSNMIAANLLVAALLLRNHFGGEDNTFASYISYMYMFRAGDHVRPSSDPRWCAYKMSSYRLLFEYNGFRDGEAESVCHGIYTSVQIFNMILLLSIMWQVMIDSPFTFRVLVSKNKQRYLDLKNEFDLDLTMITSRLIAMGVPVEYSALSMEHIWRNPISEVKRFLDSGPPSTHYRIYNCCPECPYPASYFHHRVKPFDVQDHSPVGMQVIFEFLRDARFFVSADPRNTLVIHCKAGKGRTGTLCCAWLLYTQKASCASEALELFAERRTDHIKTKKRKKKMIAVDTWSQVRLIHDLDRWLSSRDMYIGNGALDPEPPPELPATMLSVRLENVMSVKEEDGYWVDVEVVCPVWVGGQPGRVVGSATCRLQNGVHTFMQLRAPVQGDFRINIYRRKLDPADAAALPNQSRYTLNVPSGSPASVDFTNAPPSETKGDLEAGTEEAKRLNALAPPAILQPPPRPKMKKPCKAGKEPGLLFYIFAHTAFLDNSGTLLLSKHELGDTKLMKKLDLLDEGKIRIEYSTDPHSLTRDDREAIDSMGVLEHQLDLHVAADDLLAKLNTLQHHEVPHMHLKSALPGQLLKRIRQGRGASDANNTRSLSSSNTAEDHAAPHKSLRTTLAGVLGRNTMGRPTLHPQTMYSQSSELPEMQVTPNWPNDNGGADAPTPTPGPGFSTSAVDGGPNSPAMRDIAESPAAAGADVTHRVSGDSDGAPPCSSVRFADEAAPPQTVRFTDTASPVSAPGAAGEPGKPRRRLNPKVQVSKKKPPPLPKVPVKPKSQKARNDDPEPEESEFKPEIKSKPSFHL